MGEYHHLIHCSGDMTEAVEKITFKLNKPGKEKKKGVMVVKAFLEIACAKIPIQS